MSHRLSGLACGLVLAGLLIDGRSAPVASPSTAGLLGASADVVLERLGPPHRVHPGSMTRWVWRDTEKNVHELVLHEGRVVHVGAGLETAELVREPRPEKGAYPGQAVAEVLSRLGNPEAARSIPLRAGPGPVSVRLRPGEVPAGHRHVLIYGATWVTIDLGRVVRAGVEQRPRASGPR